MNEDGSPDQTPFGASEGAKRKKLIEERERHLLKEMIDSLGLNINPKNIEPLIQTMSDVIFGRVVNKIDDLFEKLASQLGSDIGRMIAGEAEHFAVTGRRYDGWIQCDSGGILIEPGKTFSLTFFSGLRFDLYYDPKAIDDSFDFVAGSQSAKATFGPHFNRKLHPLEVSLGPEQRSVPTLFFFFDVEPRLVKANEVLLNLRYNIFRRADVDLEQWRVGDIDEH